MKTKLILFGIVLALILVSGCGQETINKNDKCIDINVHEGSAWYDLTPGSDPIDYTHPLIVIPITIKHNPNCSPYNISLEKATVIQSDEVVGDFQPIYQYLFDCDNKRLSVGFHETVYIKEGCKIDVSIRAERNQNTSGINPNKEIKVKFKLYDNNTGYESDFFITKDIPLEYTS